MRVIVLLFIFLATNSVYGQNEVLIPFRDSRSGKLGYINIEGEVVIAPKYVQAHNFCKEGFAFVLGPVSEVSGPPRPGAPSEEVWKIIDARGNEIDHPFDIIRPISKSKDHSNSRGFIDGIAIIDNGTDEFVLSTDMKVLFKEGFDNIYPFKDGYTIAIKDGYWYALKDDGSVNKFEDETLMPKNKYYSEGLVRVIETNSGKSLLGFIDTKGKVAVQAEFRSVGDFTGCGLTWARSASDKDSIGIINRSGEWVVKPTFDMVMDFDKEAQATIAVTGEARQSHKKLYAVIKVSGKTMPLGDSVQRLFKFSNGLAMFRLAGKNGNLGYLDNNGQVVVSPIYDEGRDFEGDIGIVEIGHKWGAVNKKGEELIPCEYDEVHSFHDGFVVLEKNKLYGFYNCKENRIIEPQFKEVRHFKDGYAAALDRETKQWGMIDSTGAWKVKPNYEMLYYATSIDE